MKSLYLSIFKNRKTSEDSDVLVKQIHDEIDSLEVKFEKEYSNLLKELAIPTENQITKKAEKLKKLGLNYNNEAIIEGEKVIQSISEAREKQRIYRESLHQQEMYKNEYPLDKIVSLEDFKKVLIKYNLVYSDIGNYIKDIPEKNVDEMLNSIPTNENHIPEDLYYLVKLDFEIDSWRDDDYKKEAKKALKYLKSIGGVLQVESSDPYYISRSFPGGKQNHDLSYTLRNFSESKIVTVDNSKLFIAAPKSHFNVKEGIINNGKQLITGVKAEKSTYTEIKDPIAFYKLRGDFIRIVSKWGTSDDQSFLDPIVQNEKLN